MNGAGIYLDGAGRADCSPLMDLGGKALYMGWLGARGFRDFSRLPPVQENRGQPEDPASHFFADSGARPNSPKGARYDR